MLDPTLWYANAFTILYQPKSSNLVCRTRTSAKSQEGPANTLEGFQGSDLPAVMSGNKRDPPRLSKLCLAANDGCPSQRKRGKVEKRVKKGG